MRPKRVSANLRLPWNSVGVMPPTLRPQAADRKVQSRYERWDHRRKKRGARSESAPLSNFSILRQLPAYRFRDGIGAEEPAGGSIALSLDLSLVDVGSLTTTNSTRRLTARAHGVCMSISGLSSPKLTVEMREASTPRRPSSAFTVSARCMPSF